MSGSRRDDSRSSAATGREARRDQDHDARRPEGRDEGDSPHSEESGSRREDDSAGKAPRVLAFDLDGDKWFAATNDGVFVSSDKGRSGTARWLRVRREFIAVNTLPDGGIGLVAPKHAYLSHDEGKTWSQIPIPQYVTGLYNLTQGGDGSVWLGTREGALHSTDNGATWDHVLGGLPARQVYVVRYDAPSQRLLATAQHTHGVYESKDGGKSWRLTADTGVSIRAAMNFQGRISGGLGVQRTAVAAG